MYSCKNLDKKNLSEFKELNIYRKFFNELNQDFFNEYDSKSYAKKVYLLKKVTVIKKNQELYGYVWVSYKGRNKKNIKSIYLKEEDYDGFNILVNEIKGKSSLVYLCKKNEFNFNMLSAAGFKKKEGSFELKASTYKSTVIQNSGIIFQHFQKCKDEKLRCNMQNSIFKSPKRIPLTVQDIYFDQLQSYYYNHGSVFIKLKDDFIGYGQIILEDNIPIIVNFGILQEYRNKGYGKNLLIYLLTLLKEEGYEEVYIRVSSSNERALSLYTGCGFSFENEIFNWIL